jgi:hypothetical protein
MAIHRFERLFASGIYLSMVVSAGHTFSVGIANAIASGYHYTIEEKLLLGAALAGAATLVVSAILVHFHAAKAYVVAMVALQLLLVAFFPLILPIILVISVHRTLSFSAYGINDLLPVVLLAVAAVFTPLRLLRLVRS